MKKSENTAFLYAEIECPYCGTDDPAHPIVQLDQEEAIIKCVNCFKNFSAIHDGDSL